MLYPENFLAQLVLRTCKLHRINRVVLSPGSRNAPLSIGFFTAQKINVFKVVDERVAGFFGIGLAQKTRKPVLLLCTSGSALLNYYPALAEAFYSNVPLIVLSADRPKNLIDIGDGQTIRQKGVFKNHCIYNEQLSEKRGFSKGNFQKLHRAFAIAKIQKTPVHINIPFSEPLYNTTKNRSKIPTHWKKNRNKNCKKQRLKIFFKKLFAPPAIPSKKHLKIWKNTHRKIILVGTHPPCNLLKKALEKCAQDPSVLIFHEANSNVNIPNTFAHIDRFLEGLTAEDLKNIEPDLLLTVGGMIVSKKIKAFLRRCKLKHHWQINPHQKQDTFFQLTQFFKGLPVPFLAHLLTPTKTKNPYQKWALKKERQISKTHQKFLKNIPFCDLSVFQFLSKNLPSKIDLHAANSTPIRYLQLFPLPKKTAVFCNRGTSGIDGSTSTAIGAAVASNRQTFFITGDLSFFYDSNALWNENIPADFRIVLVNNKGGGIFRCIEGPKKSGALDFFETPHKMTAENLCKQFGFGYANATNFEELQDAWKYFLTPSKHPKIIEIQTDPSVNEKIFERYFRRL